MNEIKYFYCHCGYNFSEHESDDSECPLCGSYNTTSQWLTEEEVIERQMAKA